MFFSFVLHIYLENQNIFFSNSEFTYFFFTLYFTVTYEISSFHIAVIFS